PRGRMCPLLLSPARSATRPSLPSFPTRRSSDLDGRATVLGLATGSTPIGVYRELIRLHREEDLDFARVITFNLDEYWPMPPDSRSEEHTSELQSRENLVCRLLLEKKKTQIKHTY